MKRRVSTVTARTASLLACVAVAFLSSAVLADPVTLHGTIRLPALPGANVTVWVGDQSTATTADETGRFSVDVDLNTGRITRLPKAVFRIQSGTYTFSAPALSPTSSRPK